MKSINVIGLDLAKTKFHVHGVNKKGEVVVRREFGRGALIKFMKELKPCLVGVEACCGAHYWSRELRKYGHEVKIMAPQYVKAYVKTNKNDFNDAEAICEAVQRPNMRFVPQKSEEQQGIQMLHRTRSHFVRSRTMVVNETRGFLSEFGIVIPKGVKRFRVELERLLQSEQANVGSIGFILRNNLGYFDLLQEQIAKTEERLKVVFDKNPSCKRLITIPGVGYLTATAIIANIVNINDFRNGRHLAAFWGLVPRQNSSGGKTQLGGISKRGDSYLRQLLIHGGRAVVRTVGEKTDKRSTWIREKAKSRGKNKAAVAVANKNARVIWKILKSEEVFRVAA